VELEKLKKLIMAENDKTFGGKIKNQKIILDSRTSAIKKTKDSLKEGHKKLVVEESELPTELFAPYKTLEEKLNSLNKIEDITAFENNLLSKVAEKKKEKLSAIADEAIQTIKKELQGGDYELGQNKDFEKMIKGMIDPDDIERRKIILLDLIAEQKQAAQSDVVENTKKTKQEKPGTS
jgi:hypothetical protein